MISKAEEKRREREHKRAGHFAARAWLREADKPTFDRLVEAAQQDVQRIEGKADEA